MKALYFLFIIFLFSCEPTVVFDQAQPPGIDALGTIPESFVGTYRCQSDSSLVIIEPHVAYQQANYKVVVSLDQIEETENCSLAAGGLYIPGRKECFPVEYISDDTVTAYITEIDTLFYFNDSQVIKEWRGALIINQKLESTDWMVWTLQRNDDGSLLLDYISIPEEITDMKDISKEFTKESMSEDYERYVLSPTLREFDNLIDNLDYHMNCDLFIPVTLEIDRVF